MRTKIPIITRSCNVLLALMLFCFTSASFAFKVDTHVWIGQQVINDLSDDAITVEIDGQPRTFPIDPALSAAIKNNPAQFRMGNIGPDALPDLLTGQQVVHPGLANGWKTDDWLEWLLKNANTPEEKAFAYGYLGHAASDIFAHTYVNQYAGSIFDLLDLNQDPQMDVEFRHYLLESYIAEHNPPFLDANGTDLGNAYDLVKSPAPFIVQSLILNDTAANQYSIGGGAGMQLSGINRLHKNLAAILAPDGELAQLEALASAKILEYNTNISVNQALAQKVIDAQNNFSTALNNAVDTVQTVKDVFLSQVSDIVSAHAADVATLGATTDKVVALSNKLLTLASQHAAELAKLVTIPKTVVTQSCNNVCTCAIGVVGCLKKICNQVCNAVTVSNPVWDAQNALVQQIQAAIDTLQAELNAAINSARGAAQILVDAELKLLDIQNQALNVAINVSQRFVFQFDPLRGYLQGYLHDIDASMIAYVGMSQDIIVELMKPNGSPLTPAKDWLSCWGTALLATPSPITNAQCKIYNEAEKAVTELNDLLNRVLSDPLLSPLGAQIVKLRDAIQQMIIDEAKRLASRFVEQLTGLDIQKIEAILDSDPNTLLDIVFASDNSKLGLMIIPDMKMRVDEEMHLTADGTFDSNLFSIVKNAVTLAKLALLDVNQLNNLAEAAGAGRVYGQSTGSVINVLVGAVKSIDGNHQWMEFAPPYPRMIPDTATNYNYGYPYNPTGAKTGMLLWNSDQASQNAFRRIFQGPLNEALYTPDALNPPVMDVLPSTVQYHPTITNAFPTWCANNPERTQACSGSFLPVTDTTGSSNIQAPTTITVTWSGNAPPIGYSANVINNVTGQVVARVRSFRLAGGYWVGRARLSPQTVSGSYYVQFTAKTIDATFGQPKSDIFVVSGL